MKWMEIRNPSSKIYVESMAAADLSNRGTEPIATKLKSFGHINNFKKPKKKILCFEKN